MMGCNKKGNPPSGSKMPMGDGKKMTPSGGKKSTSTTKKGK